MKNFAFVLGILLVSSCATQPMKSEDLQTKVFIGMSTADVISTLGIPKDKKVEDKGQLQLTYDGYVLNFVDSKLSSCQNISQSGFSDLQLKIVADQKPGYMPDSLVLNKDIVPVATAYQISGYLHDENLFEKAVAAGIKRNGFTLKTNALCVALTEGFVKGAADVLKAGFNPDLQLRSDKVTIFPENCLNFQKDPTVAEELKKLLLSEKQASAIRKATEQKEVADGKQPVDPKNAATTNNEDSKSLFDWSVVADFLKPTAPPPTSRINH